ncbi:hypothetical protein JCM8795_16960 [Hydrogenobaculum acidophilum]
MEQILKVRPEKLYVFSDGPRNEEEAEDVYRVREYITNECKNHGIEFKSLFMDKNLGITDGIFNAINWVFNHEEFLVYLEDDTLPNTSFFYFVERMLEIYKDEEKVSAITGKNLVNEYVNDIRFSKWAPSWGMGFWKNRWDLFLKQYSEIFNNNLCKDYIYKALGYIDYRYSKLLDAYFYYFIEKMPIDGKYHYFTLYNKTFYIKPTKNLIQQLGWLYGTNANVDNYIGELPPECLKEIDINSIKYKKPLHDIEVDIETINILKSFDLFHGITKENIRSQLTKILMDNGSIAIYGAGIMGLTFYKVWDDMLYGNVCCFLDDNAT